MIAADRKSYYLQMYAYFRMALVAGFVELSSVITWADEEILHTAHPPEELIELSLAGKLPHSQMIYLLSSFLVWPDFDLPLKLVLARARMLMEEEPQRAGELILSLRLLALEEHIPLDIKTRLLDLDFMLASYRQSLIAYEEVQRLLEEFLAPYCEYQQLVYPPAGSRRIIK